jgi:hypothetical protein
MEYFVQNFSPDSKNRDRDEQLLLIPEAYASKVKFLTAFSKTPITLCPLNRRTLKAVFCVRGRFSLWPRACIMPMVTEHLVLNCPFTEKVLETN